MRTGLIKSLNFVTVDVPCKRLARVANTAQRFGLPFPNPYPAWLWNAEATPLEIAQLRGLR